MATWLRVRKRVSAVFLKIALNAVTVFAKHGSITVIDTVNSTGNNNNNTTIYKAP